MIKNCIRFTLLLLPILIYSESYSTIELKQGTNEISIKVLNKSDIDFKSINIFVEKENIPNGLTISQIDQHLDVSAKSQSENGLLLQIKVDENLTQGIYSIPFILKDKTNNSWNYNLHLAYSSQYSLEYSLLPNYPNPFNMDTNIQYTLVNDKAQDTQLVIFDLMGRQIRTLVNKKQLNGIYTVTWNGKDEAGKYVSSGFYIYKLTSGPFTMTRKMLLLK